MKRFAPVAVALVLVAFASTASPQEEADHAPDYRAAFLIAPLNFPPKPNAPFMAIAKTLVVRTLPDGSTVTDENQRLVARDMDGRIFQERRTFVPVPDDGKHQSIVHATDYTDPVAHTLYRCNAYAKICNIFAYDEPVSQGLRPAGLQPDGMSYLTRENLGTDTFEGLEVQHSRETFTFYKQSVGNTGTILRTVEYWYSAALGINVKVVRHDPRDGDQTLWLTDIAQTAPDPATFRAPADYRVVDHRSAEAQPADSQR
jgi:hypothetical protein